MFWELSIWLKGPSIECFCKLNYFHLAWLKTVSFSKINKTWWFKNILGKSSTFYSNQSQKGYVTNIKDQLHLSHSGWLICIVFRGTPNTIELNKHMSSTVSLKYSVLLMYEKCE